MKDKTKFVVETTATPEDGGPWKPEFARVNPKKVEHYARYHRKNKWYRFVEVKI